MPVAVSGPSLLTTMSNEMRVAGEEGGTTGECLLDQRSAVSGNDHGDRCDVVADAVVRQIGVDVGLRDSR